MSSEQTSSGSRPCCEGGGSEPGTAGSGIRVAGGVGLEVLSSLKQTCISFPTSLARTLPHGLFGGKPHNNLLVGVLGLRADLSESTEGSSGRGSVPLLAGAAGWPSGRALLTPTPSCMFAISPVLPTFLGFLPRMGWGGGALQD